MTYEDVKRIRANPTAENCENAELSEMIDKAIDKQIDKKIRGLYAGICECGRYVYANMNYCSGCGQKLDWSAAIEHEKLLDANKEEVKNNEQSNKFI